MKGNNTLTLNEATMIEIVQYWLDNKALNKDEPHPKVSSVKTNSQRMTFDIELESNNALPS